MINRNYRQKLPKIQYTHFLIGAITVVAILICVITTIHTIKNQASTAEAVSSDSVVNLPAKPSLVAEHAIVWDQKTQEVIYSKQATQQYPIASITKVLTAMVGADFIPDNTTIEITSSDLSTEGVSGLIAGEQWAKDDLIEFMLLTSSNDAAEAIARTALVNSGHSSEADMFQVLIDDIGAESIIIQNPTGLDVVDGVEASNFANATDLVKIAHYFNNNYPDLANASGQQSATYTTNLKTHDAESTNMLGRSIPHIDSAKTGFTTVAGGNLLTVVEIGPVRPVYIVVLGSTQDSRFSDVKKLYDYSEAIIQNYD